LDRTVWNRRRILTAAGSLGVAAVVSRAASAQAPAMGSAPAALTKINEPFVTVKTANGSLRGGHSRGALAFKGIPYASAPTGKGRFVEAGAAPSWTGVRDALALGAPSLQLTSGHFGENEPASSEDCLFLNVWTPAVSDGHKRPVMFYIHGGGYHTGSAGAPSQDGAHLAATYDVVVVACNHRLGLLGYMFLGDLGGEAYATSGNQSMLDIVAALHWVQDNIAAFGGDPSNVMIFGESGGGFKTGTLLAMPSAHGLFHKASVESGAALTRLTRDQATDTARRVLKGLGIEPNDLQKLADVPAQAILDIQVDAAQGKGALVDPNDPQDGRLHRANFLRPGAWGPVVDGTILPGNPFDPAASPVSANIPMMVGHNRDEATFFNMGRADTFNMDAAALKTRLSIEFADNASRIETTYRGLYPHASPSQLYIAIASDVWFGNDAVTAAERKSQQPAPVYLYRYDYQSDFIIPGTTYPFGAGHASEINMKFYNADLRGLQGSGPGVAKASRNMSEMWATFARTSHPAAVGQPAWPAYDQKSRQTMIIDVDCHVETDLEGDARRMWESIGPSV
jgi:para-nitrobenzyl esterase